MDCWKCVQVQQLSVLPKFHFCANKGTNVRAVVYIHQEPLTSLSSSGIIAELQSLSDVCESLSAVEVALGFLAMTGGDEHMALEDYLEKRLQMGNQTAPHILKVSQWLWR